MDQITLILADIVLTACERDGLWDVSCRDCLTGKHERSRWTHVELSCVLALALGSDDMPCAAELYKVAEPLFGEWDKSVRPIP